MLPDVGGWELVIIVLVIFLVFGARRLPEIASGLGKGIRTFKREMQGITDEIQRADEPSSRRMNPRPTDESRTDSQQHDDGPAML